MDIIVAITFADKLKKKRGWKLVKGILSSEALLS